MLEYSAHAEQLNRSVKVAFLDSRGLKSHTFVEHELKEVLKYLWVEA